MRTITKTLRTGNKTIIKDIDGNEYVYMKWAGNSIPYLVPYIETKKRSKKYWTHFDIPKDSWINIHLIKDYSIYPLSKNEFEQLEEETKNAHKKILEKFKNSF